MHTPQDGLNEPAISGSALSYSFRMERTAGPLLACRIIVNGIIFPAVRAENLVHVMRPGDIR